MGGPAPSAVSVSVDGISLGFLADRFEDSVASDAAAWARWADAVASGALRSDGGSRRGGALNSGHTMMEHLPLLASLPHDLISSLLPQGFGLGPGGVTLRATSAGAVLQTMLFAVLASHSLGAVLAGAEAFVAGLTGMPAPCRRPRLSTLVEAAGATQPVVCLCETEASPAVDDLQDMARRGQRKMVQVALGLQASPAADSAKAGVPAGEQPNRWGASGPVATAAATSASVLELVDECKDVGYWLLLHIVPQDTPKPSAAESTGVAADACGGWQLLEWIWFNMSTPSFRAAVDENFRLFVVVDARQPQLLPDWIFRSSCDAICVFDSQTGLSLRPWLELSLNSLRRKTPLMPEISTQATTPTNSKGKYDLLGGYRSLQDAASNSRLAAQGRMAKITSSTVLFSRLTQPSFVLKLGLTALRLSLQLVLAAVAACERATCLPAAWLMRARPIGGLDADLADEALHRLIQLQGFEASVTIRSVDVLEIVATLIVHQAEEVGPLWVDVGGNPGPGASPILYNMLRFFRQSHLSRHRQDTTGPPPSADSSKMSQLSSLEASKRTSTQRNSSLNVLSAVGRKSKKPMEVEAIVDEALWYHDENYEPSEGSLWTIFGQVADLVDDLLSKGEPGQPLLSDEADTAAAAEILKLLPLVDHHSTVRLAGAAPQVFALALPFARARPGQLHLPPLPSLKEPSERSSSASLPMMGEDASVASEEVDEVQDGQDGLDTSISSRKVSGVETLQFQIPSIGVVPSASSEESEDDVEGLLAQRLFDMESQSASKEGLIHLLKATILCISSSGLCEEEAEEEPVGSESSLQAEWRRQRQGIASWARGICHEAEDLVRGLREGLDTLSPELALKLRHLLHTAQVWAMRAAPQEAAEISPPPPHLGDCPAEVWHVAKSPLALSSPVPDGWQPPDYLEEASFGAWLGRLAQRLHQVYLPRDVPKRLHVADLGQVAPMLLALRLDFAAQRRCLAEQTCLVFLPVGQDEDEAPSSPRSDLLKGEKCVVEDFTTWDELDVDKPPCFEPASELPSSLMAAMAPLKHRGKDDNLASEVLRPPSPPMTPQKSAPPRMFGEETPPSARAAGATLKQSVRKIQILGALSGKATRRQSVAVRKKAKDTKENKIFHKDLANSDLILTGLLADGAVWSSVSGLYIDGNVAGLTRLPPLRAVATTLRTAEQFTAQCFPQASGCINLTVYRVMSTSWPMPPQGSLKSAPPREVCALRLPFVTRSGFKWQPLALLDALPPQPCRGHLRQWATEGSRDNEEVHGNIEDQLQEPLSLPRPFALHPEALPTLAGPPNISTRIAKQSIPD
ncbi:unnamed protein product [Symbiodinium sp. CCMP2456]|nr:unnamed protein product [Symbiodinium sp. CCMP2456]